VKFLFYNTPNRTWDDKIKELAAEFQDVQFIPQDSITDDDIEEAHAFVGIAPPDHLEKAAGLKIIFVSFTGPNMLPLDNLRERGIRLSNTHGNARFVAERAISLAMAFYGKIIAFHEDLKNEKWHGIWGGGGPEDTWESLFEKDCAVIGAGEIGKWIARYLKMFDCNVIGFRKRTIKDNIAEFDKVTLDLSEALEKSEIVFITLPLTDETEGMFDSKILFSMKDKFIVNVGRGAVIDEEGLYSAIKQGILKGAALDVWFNYPEWGKGRGRPSRFPFHELDNVILSPHVGGYVPRAASINTEKTIDNIRAYLKTGKPLFEIDFHLKY
jgi:phosphoglycerate dehydrogenase-like enzyme